MNTLRPRQKISLTARKALDAAKEAARLRIVKREFVQFRTDQQTMDLLLRVSNHRREPLGVMVRKWVEERLGREVQQLPLPSIKMPSGELLTDKGSQRAIEKALLQHQNGVVKLSEKEYQTLFGWLMDRHLAAKYAKTKGA